MKDSKFKETQTIFTPKKFNLFLILMSIFTLHFATTK